MTWRKNKLREDMVRRFGPEIGLPLFNIAPKMEAAPKSMYVATETKNAAHKALKDELGDKQKQVLDVLYRGKDWTNSEIARYLSWSINRVTGRIFELRQMGKVMQSEKRVCNITGRVVQAWKSNHK
jgi:DNA-directed RNA polymerase specialized sigma24 family protein